MKMRKFSLSKGLENEFFKSPLKAQQLESLKRHLENYQIGETPRWNSKNFLPYSSYLGFITAQKTKSALSQIEEAGYLEWAKEGPLAIIDVGAGTGGASLGAFDFFNEKQMSTQQLMMIDRDLRALKWALQEFDEKYFPPKVILKKQFPKELRPKRSVVIFANVLAELGLHSENFKMEPEPKFLKDIKTWIKLADKESLFIFIEPANFVFNQNFLKLRDSLREEFEILLPCTHQKKCPALQQNEWCHEEWAYKAPNHFWEIVRTLGFRKKFLSYSFLCIGKQKSHFKNQDARVVSSDLRAKGICEKWMCADGKRWKVRKLLRDEKAGRYKEFFESKRGSILDCHSTDLLASD